MVATTLWSNLLPGKICSGDVSAVTTLELLIKYLRATHSGLEDSLMALSQGLGVTTAHIGKTLGTTDGTQIVINRSSLTLHLGSFPSIKELTIIGTLNFAHFLVL